MTNPARRSRAPRHVPLGGNSRAWRTGIVIAAILGAIITMIVASAQVMRGWNERRAASVNAIKQQLAFAGTDFITLTDLNITLFHGRAFAIVANGLPHVPSSKRLGELARFAERNFAISSIQPDSLRDYFSLTLIKDEPVLTAVTPHGIVRDTSLARMMTDSIRTYAQALRGQGNRFFQLYMDWNKAPFAMILAPIVDSNVIGGDTLRYYGTTYSRRLIVATYAQRIRDNVQFMPAMFNGVDWVTGIRIAERDSNSGSDRSSEDSTQRAAMVRANKVLAIRLTDVAGTLLYESPNVTPDVWTSPYRWKTDMTDMDLVVHVAIPKTLGDRIVESAVPLRSEQWLFGGVFLMGVLFIGAAAMEFRRQRQLARTRADFISAISHELRTPLTHVSILSETLLLGGAENPEQERRWLQAINREAQRLGSMVENVLLVARGERQNMMVDRRPFDISAIARDMAAVVQPFADSHNTRIDVHVPEVCEVPVDANGIRQILLNLLDNAVKYGPRGQTITLTIESPSSDDSHATIMVDDQGPGIPPDDRERIWLPFVRLEHTNATSSSGGSGLGLNVVRYLAEQHGGAAFATDAPGGGARLVVTIECVGGAEAIQVR